jgi:CheY-like chemotaxis protein
VALRLLLVEDDPEQALLWLPRLRAHGYQCWHVASGPAALQVAAELPFDVVLMDIGLGAGMNGIEAALRLRLTDPHLPVIFLSASDDGETLERAKLALPAGYVFKPFRFEQLIDAIERGTSRTMPDISNDHDVLIRVETKLDLVSVQLAEVRGQISGKVEQAVLEPRLAKVEAKAEAMEKKMYMIIGGLIVIEILLKLLGK